MPQVAIEASRNTMECASTLTDRYQTTVPKMVRDALHLGKKDTIKYQVNPNGSVTMFRVSEPENDPVLDRFLQFISDDMEAHPEHLMPLDTDIRDGVDDLIKGLDVDLNAPLLDEDD